MSCPYTVRSGARLLRCGWTTGTCAALAAGGAARYLLSGTPPGTLRLVTPKGRTAEAEPAELSLSEDEARCAVRKDAGDDPDVTDGCLVRAAVRLAPEGVTIDGGEGIGRVTKPGLDQPVGAAAINSVPRRMIAGALREAAAELGYAGGFAVTVSIPGGEALARRTLNAMLGIEGGLSVLGTSGTVEPMSERALADTVCLEIRQAAAGGARRLILTPGNYGLAFLRRSGLDRMGIPAVKYSNFLGEALDTAAAEGFAEILLAGHIGKLVKLAGGIFNTHSRYADCRAELFVAHAALCGAERRLCRELMDAATSEACLDLLDGAGVTDAVLRSLLDAMQLRLDRRVPGPARCGAVVFSKERGELGRTAAAEELLERWGTPAARGLPGLAHAGAKDAVSAVPDDTRARNDTLRGAGTAEAGPVPVRSPADCGQ